MAEVFLVKLPSDDCDWILLTISQYQLMWWLGAFRQQAITWANIDPPDLCHHMASPSPNGLKLIEFSFELVQFISVFATVIFACLSNVRNQIDFYKRFHVKCVAFCKICLTCEAIRQISRKLLYSMYHPNESYKLKRWQFFCPWHI